MAWFHYSALVAALTGRTPYKSVIAHGFTLDQNGRKMSKSEGNVLDPAQIVDKYGADVLRVWVASSDVTEDMRVSMATMDTHAETARKIRNTMRYMVGALHDYRTASGPDASNETPELERYIRHRMFMVNHELAQMLLDCNLTQYIPTISNFCIHELSTLLFDIRKDSLYCDSRSSPERRAYRYLLHQLFHHMAIWIAPVMPFAAEELFQARYPAREITFDNITVKGQASTVHLEPWLRTNSLYRDDVLAAKWGRIIAYRSEMQSQIEQLRQSGEIKVSTECRIVIEVGEGTHAQTDLQSLDMPIADLAIAGDAELRVVEGLEDCDYRVTVTKIETPKCDRCWVSRPTVVEVGEDHLCQRCQEVVGV